MCILKRACFAPLVSGVKSLLTAALVLIDSRGRGRCGGPEPLVALTRGPKIKAKSAERSLREEFIWSRITMEQLLEM